MNVAEDGWTVGWMEPRRSYQTPVVSSSEFIILWNNLEATSEEHQWFWECGVKEPRAASGRCGGPQSGTCPLCSELGGGRDGGV